MSLFRRTFAGRPQQPLRSVPWHAGDVSVPNDPEARSAPAAAPGLKAEQPGEAGEAFEECYQRHPFSELVRLGLAFASLVKRLREGQPR